MNRNLLFCLFFFGFFCLAMPAVPAAAQFNQAETTQETSSDVFENAVSIVNFLFAVAFLFSLIGLVISAIKFVVAGGSESMIGSAHSTWMASVIGLLIALVGFVVVNIIRYYLR